MRRALLILLTAAPLFVAAIGSARADGIYICDTTTGTTCSHFSAVLDGVATFENLGLSADAIMECVGFGMGVIFLFFALGLGVGSAHRVLSIAFGSREGD